MLLFHFLLVCTDTPLWRSTGEYQGLTCTLLELEYSWCQNGSMLPDIEALFDNDPSGNCCACGKGIQGKIGYILCIWLNTKRYYVCYVLYSLIFILLYLNNSFENNKCRTSNHIKCTFNYIIGDITTDTDHPITRYFSFTR